MAVNPFTSLLFASLLLLGPVAGTGACRKSAASVTKSQWSSLNSTVDGRLVSVVPSALWCQQRGGCTDAEWSSARFRLSNIPGAMDSYNYEQAYDGVGLVCLRNNTANCAKANVPLYSVEAQTVADVQAAVKFAAAHDIRLVVKSSGHDFLGRSTAADSLMIRMKNFKTVTFVNNFKGASTSMGSAVTVGPGLGTGDLYQLAKAAGKVLVIGSAATVAAAGGYVQGAGHSILSRKFGLAADNAIQFQVVVASGQLLTVNSQSNSDLFWAIRGGGAGSWGVIVSATFRTYGTFNSTIFVQTYATTSHQVAADLMQLHASHIFDYEATRTCQYFFLQKANVTAIPILTLYTIAINQTTPQTTALLAPFQGKALAISGVTLTSNVQLTSDTNDLVFFADDISGIDLITGSRLIPKETYQNRVSKIGPAYKTLLDVGTLNILGHLVAGGQVAANSGISSAVHPGWRTALVHLLMENPWTDGATITEQNHVATLWNDKQLAAIQKMTGDDSPGAAYSNEAAQVEKHPEETFFGPNYAKLKSIKTKYDPKGLFIVRNGVGSDDWNAQGTCRLH
ncbi:FAD-binding domain-containing protein [Mycena alexandri]|uniref:FAD-binding domain-containing protein n=1 Tax=Mycena alexandri TaxID=1745969 RepID=A0AAD6WPZ6_9AGAR|nr:FAD-binding domain-containing protein [Mycena alexandri]